MIDTYKDPICGMDVMPQAAAGKSEYKGQTYYFCSMGCKNTFDAAPEESLNKVIAQAHGCC